LRWFSLGLCVSTAQPFCNLGLTTVRRHGSSYHACISLIGKPFSWPECAQRVLRRSECTGDQKMSCTLQISPPKRLLDNPLPTTGPPTVGTCNHTLYTGCPRCSGARGACAAIHHSATNPNSEATSTSCLDIEAECKLTLVERVEHRPHGKERPAIVQRLLR